MNLEDVIKVALASPPGSVVFAKRTRAAADAHYSFEVESINGEKTAEA